jgi:hypothetical protein
MADEISYIQKEVGRERGMEFGAIVQKEGMGLQEHQAMPSLRDVAHDGWLCKFN